MSNREQLHSGELYVSTEPDMLKEQQGYLELLYDFNHTRPGETDRREALLREMLAECGEGCYIEPPFHANWGGRHLHFGKMVYANFNLTVVDDTHIYVGDYTEFGPNVVLATAGHPLCPALREKGYQFNLPIRIGKRCWLGAGAIVVPGVSIGDGTVIGAGSVVTRDIPANVLAVGNPCRVLRALDERDGSTISGTGRPAAESGAPVEFGSRGGESCGEEHTAQSGAGDGWLFQGTQADRLLYPGEL